jgi:hypothetical protein
MTGTYMFAPEVLEALAEHGFRPRPTTSPERVREALSELYRYEIRRLKARLLAGAFPRAAYIDYVVQLRRRYFLLSIPIAAWTVSPARRRDGPAG